MNEEVSSTELQRFIRKTMKESTDFNKSKVFEKYDELLAGELSTKSYLTWDECKQYSKIDGLSKDEKKVLACLLGNGFLIEQN